jgi:hypothetical protein
VIYGIEHDGRLAAAGNVTPFRGYPADVGLLTRPAARGRGLAKQIAVQMIGDALPAAGIIRYRALVTNAPIAPVPGLCGVRPEPDRPAARLITGLGNRGDDAPGGVRVDGFTGRGEPGPPGRQAPG